MGTPESILPFLRYPCKPNRFIPQYCTCGVFLMGSFWELVLKLYSTEVLYPISKDNYCFEFRDDILTNIVPHYHGERLMKDEYIDGIIPV